MLNNHSCVVFVAEEQFLHGTRLSAAPEKVNSVYLRAEFRNDCRRFLKEFVSTIWSTVAARSLVGQGFSCFSPEIIVGGDNDSAFYHFGQQVDTLLNLGSIKGCKVEAAKAEFHSFVREKRTSD